MTLDQYTANLEAFAKEVTSIGAIPVRASPFLSLPGLTTQQILVTPLTRRSYTSTTPPTIIQDLSTQRNLTLTAAYATRSRHIDLNGASVRYCDAIGPDNAWKYNLNPDDRTHLNDWGSVVFGRLVSDLLAKAYIDVAAVTRPNRTLSEEIWEGVPA